MENIKDTCDQCLLLFLIYLYGYFSQNILQIFIILFVSMLLLAVIDSDEENRK